MLKSVVLHIIQTFGVNKINKQEKQNISFSTDSLNLSVYYFTKDLYFQFFWTFY